MTLSQDDELLLNAYLDGELDPLEARSFEARLASEPALAGEIERTVCCGRRSVQILPRMCHPLALSAASCPVLLCVRHDTFPRGAP